MTLTLRDVLGLDVVRRGRPRVVAGAGRLDAQVRWVHAVELTDVARLLRGGELVLSTGIALPDSGELLAAYVAELAGTGVAGLAVELGRRYASALPAALVSAANAHDLPLIEFSREVPFVEITETVHAQIIDASLAELRATERIHATFTDLSVAGAPAEQIVREAARLAGRPAVLADLAHRVLACSATDVRGVLEHFAGTARTLAGPRTFYADSAGWLVAAVGARGADWGRLYLMCDAPPTNVEVVLIEQAATTLALGRLLTRQAESLERQAHQTLIAAIIEQSHANPEEAAARARALGVPVTGRQLVALVLRLPDAGPGVSAHAAVLSLTESVAAACRAGRVPALVGSLDDVRCGALLSFPAQAGVDAALTSLAGGLRERCDAVFVIGAGTAVTSLREVPGAFIDAREVADVAIRYPGDRPFHRLPDARLRGLLHLLRDDARVQAFAERELGTLIAHDGAHGTDLLPCLAAYLAAGGNKAEAAHRAHLARPTFYQRLRLIERVLGVSLDDPESRASLHVALLASASGVAVVSAGGQSD